MIYRFTGRVFIIDLLQLQCNPSHQQLLAGYFPVTCRSSQPWRSTSIRSWGTEHRGLLQKSHRRQTQWDWGTASSRNHFPGRGDGSEPCPCTPVLCPAGNEPFLEYPTFSSRCCLHSSANTALGMWLNTGMGQWWPRPLACLALPQAAAELLVKATILQRSWLVQITASDSWEQREKKQS